MTRGNRQKGLLKDIIDLINELGPNETYRPDWVTRELLKRKTDGRPRGKTPVQTVTSYFSDNTGISGIFSPAHGGEYSLKEAFHCKPSRRS